MAQPSLTPVQRLGPRAPQTELRHAAPSVPRRSILEQLAHARSPFSVDVMLKDAEMFATGASRKVKEQWRRAAYVRKCQLAGMLP